MSKFQLLGLIVIAIIVTTSFCGLPYCKKVPFTEADLAWLNAYEEGDTILFEDNANNALDTMVITETFVLNPPNTSIFDLRGCNWLEVGNEILAVAWYYFDIHHNGEIFDGIFSLRKTCNKKPALYNILIFGKDTEENNDNKLSFTGDTLNNTGILVINDSSLYNAPYRTALPLKEVYWNREEGLIGYQIGDNKYSLKER